MPQSQQSAASILMAIVIFVLLGFPFISIFNKAQLIAGIPMLYAWVAGVWLLAIVLAWRNASRKTSQKNEHG